jgi:hypothetical protein
MTAVVTRAGRREWLGLAVLTLPTLLLALDISVLYLAVPQLTADLGATSSQQLWIMDSYGFMVAGFLVTMGTIGDRIGRRRLLLTGAAAFGVASVVAAYATSPVMLIGARALLWSPPPRPVSRCRPPEPPAKAWPARSARLCNSPARSAPSCWTPPATPSPPP